MNFSSTFSKTDLIRINEPPLKLDVNAEIIIYAEYVVADNETFTLMGSSVPDNVISAAVSVEVLMAINRALPSGFCMAQLQNPPSEIGGIALESVKNNILRFYGVVFTNVVVKEIKAEIPSFANSLLQMQKSMSENWICPNCSSANLGNFCTECGTRNHKGVMNYGDF